ncbi:MAG: hypothetical protein HZC37_19590 [Burkholderiales bacterium]|nr:hypothetical protein [Burkholderiales bacterium]
MSARWATFLVWALVAASAAAWGLKLFVTAPSAPPQVAVAGQSQLPRGDITRVLGADAPPVDPTAGESLAGAPADARFQLVGVVAPRGSETARGGVALIAVDGKPARAYRVGALVDGENIVQAIRARGADLGPSGGKVLVALNIPPPAPPTTGTLPDARSATPAAPVSRAAPVPSRAAPVAPPPAAVPTPSVVPRRGMPSNAPAPGAAPAPSMQAAPQGQVVPLPTAPGSAQPQIR